MSTDDVALSPLESELMELLSMSGEPTTVLDEEMLACSPGRDAVEAALTDLRQRGLVSSERAINVGQPRRSDAARSYEDDWWNLTPAGRALLQ